jgi:hypothetical protein
MPHLCLLLSGAALLVNGLAMLGRLPRRDAAVLSLLVGGTQLVLGVVHSASSSDASLPSAAGMFLFGLTYVYVGLDVLLDLGSRGLGWFCGMVAGGGMLLAAAWFGSDPLLGVLWLAWAALWGLLFVASGLGRAGLDPFIGWALVLASQTTATVPAFLGILGIWPRDAAAAWAAAGVVAALFVLARGLARRGAAAPAAALANNN